MSFDLNDFSEVIIRPALTEIELYSVEAHELLLGTCAQESGFGRYLRQQNYGPALGIYQMEIATHYDIWENYIDYRPYLAKLIRLDYKHGRCGKGHEVKLTSDLLYATKMARIHYFRVSAPIPDDLTGQAEYWKEHYNTSKGKGTVKEYIENYRRYVDAER